MKRSKHSLSHYKLLTCDMGELVPIGCYEALPGDTIQQASSLLVRTTPLLSPIMHPVHVRIHHWFVPTRLIWTDWENFITGGPDGLNASVPPTITVNSGTGFAVGSLADYLGVPTSVDDLPVSALPFRAYASIWNNWYRDQQLQTALTIDLTDGADTTTSQVLQRVNWEKDYFTTSRPTPQLGAAVTVPLGTSALVRTSVADNVTGAQETMHLIDASGSTGTEGRNLMLAAGGAAAISTTAATLAENGLYPQNLYADLSTASAATINQWREAIALQKYEEARNRYGARYTEYLRYLGVRSSDARLQRPEYLGGGKQTIQFSEVLQTGVTTSGTPGIGVGGMLGHGIGAVRSNRFRRFFEEHGYVISLMSVLPKTIYATGLSRHWSRSSKEDFFQKELQHIGSEEVLNKELYWADTGPNDVFGYQDRYDSYRRIESGIAGEFRTTLNFWHYARIFAADVTLNGTFVTGSPTDRVYQSATPDELLVMANHSIQARRLVDSTGSPGGI